MKVSKMKTKHDSVSLLPCWYDCKENQLSSVDFWLGKVYPPPP